MLDGNVLLRQECDEVPKGTLSCPDRIMEVFYQLRHYEGARLLPSVCGWKLIQQTLNNDPLESATHNWNGGHLCHPSKNFELFSSS